MAVGADRRPADRPSRDAGDVTAAFTKAIAVVNATAARRVEIGPGGVQVT